MQNDVWEFCPVWFLANQSVTSRSNILSVPYILTVNSHERMYLSVISLLSSVGLRQTYHGNFVPVFSVIRALSDESVTLWGRQKHKAAIAHDQMGFSTQLFVEHARMNVSWQVSIKLAGSAVCGCWYWQSKCRRSALLLVACWLQAFPVTSTASLSFSHLNTLQLLHVWRETYWQNSHHLP